jgi:hypothetical protein
MTKPFVFVLMPFSPDFNDVFELGIKVACNECDMYCERVDKQIFEERILDRIYNQITKADIIVSDLSNKNPNVLYETGYAHALGKRVIHVTNKASEITFDLAHHPHVIYESIMDLKAELKKWLSWMVANPERKSHPNISALKFQISGQFIEPKAKVVINRVAQDPRLSSWPLAIVLHIQNDSEVIFSDVAEIAIVGIDENLTRKVDDEKSVKLANGGILYQAGQLGRILPGAWTNLSVGIKTKFKKTKTYKMQLRIFTEIEQTTIPFELELKISATASVRII